MTGHKPDGDSLIQPIMQDTFWDYALAVYKTPAVKNTCLSMQDELSGNVNCLLLAMYLYKFEVSISKDEWLTVSANTHPIYSELDKHRAMRRTIKQDTDLNDAQKAARYQSALQQELILEKEQQAVILKALNTVLQAAQRPDKSASDAITNYLKTLESSSLTYSQKSVLNDAHKILTSYANS